VARAGREYANARRGHAPRHRRGRTVAGGHACEPGAARPHAVEAVRSRTRGRPCLGLQPRHWGRVAGQRVPNRTRPPPRSRVRAPPRNAARAAAAVGREEQLGFLP
jgi:hypothetical protein